MVRPWSSLMSRTDTWFYWLYPALAHQSAAQSCGGCCRCKKFPCGCSGVITGIKPFGHRCVDAGLFTSEVLAHAGLCDSLKWLVDGS